MRHKGLIIGVSLGFGLAAFLLLYLISALVPAVPVLVAVLCGVAVFAYSITATLLTYRRSGRVLTRLCEALRDEKLLYCDIASLMDRHRERTGALVVTERRLVFETPQPRLRGEALRLDFDLTRIHLVRNVRDHFVMAAGGDNHRFKVYRCDALVETVRTAAGTRTDRLRAEKERRRQLRQAQGAQLAALQQQAETLLAARQANHTAPPPEDRMFPPGEGGTPPPGGPAPSPGAT